MLTELTEKAHGEEVTGSLGSGVETDSVVEQEEERGSTSQRVCCMLVVAVGFALRDGLRISAMIWVRPKMVLEYILELASRP